MGIFDTVKKLRQSLTVEKVISIAFIDTPVEDNPLLEKPPIFSAWMFSAHLGQPRGLDIQEVRNFARSPWAQMAISTIKKEVIQIPYEIVLKDDDDEEQDIEDFQDDIDKITDFLENINSNDETLYTLMNAIITDVAEIDSGVWAKVFTAESYTIEELPLLDVLGRETGQTEMRTVLKPFGQRELKELWYADGGTFLFDVDVYRRIRGYYQYTFKHPLAAPLFFEKDEISYFVMNRRSYSMYGFSPVQACQQELELMMQSTRFNKDFFKNNAIPAVIVSLEDSDDNAVEKFTEDWSQKLKGTHNRITILNAKANVDVLSTNLNEMQWLDGQKWYFHVVFGVFGLSPAEVGFHEDVNRSTQEGQERVTVKTAIKPYLQLIEERVNTDIIPELLQTEDSPLIIKFLPKDHAAEVIEFEQAMKKIEEGVMTINEYRKSQGLDDVEWGDEPSSKQSFSASINQFPTGAQGGTEQSTASLPQNPQQSKVKPGRSEGKPKKELESTAYYRKLFEEKLREEDGKVS